MTLSQTTSPFAKKIAMQLILGEDNRFTIRLASKGAILPVAQWLTLVFYHYEENNYGLLAEATEDSVTIPIDTCLAILSPDFKNPYVTFTPYDSDSLQWLNTIAQLTPYWTRADIWQYASFTEDPLNFSLPEPQINNALFTTAVKQCLQRAGLNLTDSAFLQDFFEHGGWPLHHERKAQNVFVSLRLSEPEDNSNVWLLETVLHTATSAYWTPAIRKRDLDITQALPQKWLDLAEAISALQAQMLSLLSIELPAHTAGSFVHCELSDQSVQQFLREDLARLQALGFDIVLPSWLKELKTARMTVQATAGTSNNKTVAGLDDILTFDWQFSINNKTLPASQFAQIVEEKREFIRIGTEWFKVDANWISQIRALMTEAQNEKWTVRDMVFRDVSENLASVLEIDDDDSRDDPMLRFNLQKSLEQFVAQLRDKTAIPTLPIPANLQAELRPYQQEGFEWLHFMRQQKFGACLADDMGLGKTIQLITYLLHLYNNGATKPSLIVCPTSVLGNWQKEIARFAPSFTVHTHYTANRLKNDAFTAMLETTKPQVILTTYGTISQDSEFLQHIAWSSIVLDEAQNIKNMQTLQSRAIRTLQGEHHIALTGTPVENRLSELWAIFDFINRGYLGSFSRFTTQYILPIERDEDEKIKEKLRLKIQPFLLRRTKRDPKLLLNLPEKQEMNDYCPLTTEQAALYESYIKETMASIENLNGFEKKGKVLTMLSKLKQLCNHPALYLKEPFGEAEAMLKRSIKLQRIVQMAAEIADNNEQCLIFTQYIGMGQLLQHCFSELYDIDIPFLTGSMPKQQRDHLVERFQAGEFPIFLLSLKAGGTGLNLTAASSVLHADRWWNPAVENQATDRAYRLGQTQFVQVHKFVTIGTIEEKIDKMLEEKSALSEELIQSSKWLTELNDEELQHLMTLEK